MSDYDDMKQAEADLDRQHREMIRRKAATIKCSDWLNIEREVHALTKYGDGMEAREKLIEDIRDHPKLDGEWETFILNYLSRVKIMGLDTLAGRQALGKLIVTLHHCLETAVLVHGPMPRPGVPSGTVEHWV